jgi:hypothetical protein
MFQPGKSCCAVLFFCIAAIAFAPAAGGQEHMWSHTLGSPTTNGPESGLNVAVDPAGDVIVTGYFGGPADFGGGTLTPAGFLDIFVAKYDANGGHIWSRRFGGANSELGRDVAFDGLGNIAVCGSFSGTVDFGGGPLTGNSGGSDLFVVKLDKNGAHVWSRVFGSPRPEEKIAVTFDPFGNVLVTGMFQETVDFGGGPLTAGLAGDIFIVKYDPDGNHLWSKSIGPGGWDEGRGIVCDASGNVYVGGRFEQTVDFGGGPRTGYNLFVAKYDPNGNYITDRDYGGQYLDTCYDIALDNDGNILLTGFFRGTVDFGGGPITATGNGDIYVVKFDPDFNHVWSRGMGGTHTGLISVGYRIAADANGAAFVTGRFNTTVDFGGGPLDTVGPTDIFVAKYDATGAHVWSRQFGGEDGATGYGIAVDAAGDVIMTGGFSGTADFGDGPVEAQGNNDIVIAKYEGSPSAGPVRAGFDLMAGRCPPPFNVKKRGALPAAILGTADFDVRDIDMATVRLEGAVPVAAGRPVDFRTAGELEDCGCNEHGPDGFDDVRLRFMAGDVVDGMTPGSPGDIVTLTLTGELTDGTPFVARECVQLVGAGANRPDSDSPTAPVLRGASPNPFNPVTTISYYLSEPARVEISVFDVRGERVATLVDRAVDAGEHTAIWDADGMPSGMYFYRMTAGDYVVTRKLVLLK